MTRDREIIIIIIIIITFHDTFTTIYNSKGGRDSSVDIATCYGLKGPGIESRWG